jgi:DNA-binding NarL/FixJ family response regulator
MSTPRFTQPIKVLHIEADAAERERFQRILTGSAYPEFVVHAVPDLGYLLRGGGPPFSPDLVLLDLHSAKPSYPTDDPFKLFSDAFLQIQGHPLILMTTDNLDYDDVYDAIRAGADNVLVRGLSSPETARLFIVKSLARHRRFTNVDRKLAETWRIINELKEDLKVA